MARIWVVLGGSFPKVLGRSQGHFRSSLLVFGRVLGRLGSFWAQQIELGRGQKSLWTYACNGFRAFLKCEKRSAGRQGPISYETAGGGKGRQDGQRPFQDRLRSPQDRPRPLQDDPPLPNCGGGASLLVSPPSTTGLGVSPPLSPLLYLHSSSKRTPTCTFTSPCRPC